MLREERTQQKKAQRRQGPNLSTATDQPDYQYYDFGTTPFENGSTEGRIILPGRRINYERSSMVTPCAGFVETSWSLRERVASRTLRRQDNAC